MRNWPRINQIFSFNFSNQTNLSECRRISPKSHSNSEYKSCALTKYFLKFSGTKQVWWICNYWEMTKRWTRLSMEGNIFWEQTCHNLTVSKRQKVNLPQSALLYISTSVWVLRTPNAGQNSYFWRFCCKKPKKQEICSKF